MCKYIIVMLALSSSLLQNSVRGLGLEIDESCQFEDGSGKCKLAADCWHVKEDLRKGIAQKICGFKKRDSIVCCRPDPRPEVELTTRKPLEKECDPIPTEAIKVNRTGKKAWDKCIDYLQYAYPCVNTSTYVLCKEGGGKPGDMNWCKALLGFGEILENAKWSCGGTVISKNYVLTANHCTYTRDFGQVKFVRVGFLKLSSPIDPKRVHGVRKIEKHPDRKPPGLYNDIALIKTSTPIILDVTVYPACLHTGNPVSSDLIATSWGLLGYQGSSSDILQKVNLEHFSLEECKHHISVSRLLKKGIHSDSQICAGDHFRSRDTCQGDSGGPLQVKSQDMDCMYIVVGVTSFGRGCGTAGVPSVCTRVSYYVDWIESIVWP